MVDRSDETKVSERIQHWLSLLQCSSPFFVCL
jgi:hypothetical protein